MLKKKKTAQEQSLHDRATHHVTPEQPVTKKKKKHAVIGLFFSLYCSFSMCSTHAYRDAFSEAEAYAKNISAVMAGTAACRKLW